LTNGAWNEKSLQTFFALDNKNEIVHASGCCGHSCRMKLGPGIIPQP